MKKLTYILLFMLGAIIYSCTPDKYEIYDFDSNPAQVDTIDLALNSHILYANGVNQLYVEAFPFDINKVWRKDKVTLADGTLGSKDSLYIDMYRVQLSRVEDPIEYYKEDGTKLPDNAAISTTTVEDFKIYVQIGDIRSRLLEIDVREPIPDREKKIIPVIFHVLESDGLEGGFNVPLYTSELLKKKLEEVNFTLNHGNGTKVSNEGNPNIEFRLALYDPDGNQLEEEGINRKSTSLQGGPMKPFMVENTWDPKKYMNIFLCAYSPSNKSPHTVLLGVDPLPGLSFTTEVEADDPLDLSEPTNSGIIIGGYDIGGAWYWTFSNFWFVREFCKYLGLLETQREDHCEDTHQHGYDASPVEGWVRNNEGYKMFETNIVGSSYSVSTYTTLSAEQVERIHWVLENCPTHWAWKSDFAFTGTE